MKTIGDEVKEHAKQYGEGKGGGTDFGLKCLGLEDKFENYPAANLYVSALSLLAKEFGYKIAGS